MQDEAIVELFFMRDESALTEAEKKYSGYLCKTAFNILADEEDSKEILNETLLCAWRSIPPHRPKILRTYLCKIARQLSIDRYRLRNRKKRIACEFTASLDELEEIAGGEDINEKTDLKLLGETIDRYLKTLPEAHRVLFVRRYFFGDTIKEIARAQRVSESKVKGILYRVRQGLKVYLEKEGYEV